MLTHEDTCFFTDCPNPIYARLSREISEISGWIAITVCRDHVEDGRNMISPAVSVEWLNPNAELLAESPE